MGDVVGPLRASALALEFGFLIGAFVTTGVLAGRFLDDALNTKPWLFLVGVLLALGSSFYTMYLLYKWQK